MVWRVHVTQLAADVGIEAEDGATVNEDLCKDVEAGQVSVLPIFLRLRARRGFSAGH